MFEFGDVRFRPVEKDDLKLLHRWENDFELMMYSRTRPLNFVSMEQIERRYDEWTKQIGTCISWSNLLTPTSL